MHISSAPWVRCVSLPIPSICWDGQQTINTITVGPLSELDLSLWYSSSDKEFPTRSHSNTYFLPSPLKSFLSLSWLGQLNQNFVESQKVKRIKILFKRVTHYSRGFFFSLTYGGRKFIASELQLWLHGAPRRGIEK